MVQQLRALDAFPEDMGPVLGNQTQLTTVYNTSSGGSDILFDFRMYYTHVVHRHTCRLNTHADTLRKS